MATLNFTVKYATTLAGLQGVTATSTVYTEDLGNCATCLTDTGSCWACLTTEQKVFNDAALITPVADGYYDLVYASGSNAVWHIIGGYPQTEGFFN